MPVQTQDFGVETLPGTSLPHSERFLESSFTGCALLDCQDRTPAIVIDDWNIEPGSAIEKFSIPLYILFGRRKADKEPRWLSSRWRPRAAHRASVPPPSVGYPAHWKFR